jgi:hypothetical protein
MTISTVPLHITGPSPLLLASVTVNGQGPFSFILDTGASHLMIDQALAATLDLPPVAGPAGGMGAGGDITVAMVRLDEIQLGHARLHDAAAGVIDLGPVSRAVNARIQGIIGHPFLSQHVVTIDYPRRELRLRTRPPPHPS